ncbi:transglycosylase SLT domain-containing protein [Alicyclobacillus shizuokensis]|uniref:transglycosylase SLT domain-containing protein n=1 Tax=Alicyclobacillus shizuokensis TaxID=392014 RepID=UPI00082D4071|nr:transglycosylase SLT domain-containing protein [Alicyclobacillus shizuokensis]
MATSVTSIVSQVALANGLPPWVALDIMAVESGGNPNAVGDNGTSFGLFQLHKGGGQGDGYSVSQLLDPLTNAEIAIPPIARAYKEAVAQGLSGFQALVYTADHSGHPDDVGYMPSSYESALYKAYESGGTDNGSVTTGTALDTSLTGLEMLSADAPQASNDPLTALDNALQFEGINLGTAINPASWGEWLIKNFDALVLRVVLCFVGLVLILVGLLRVIGGGNAGTGANRAATIAMMAR